jgi:hypothetical protein
VSAR